MATKKRCVIYTRISLDRSGEGNANERQELICRRKAEYKEYEVVEVIHDISKSAYSGKKRDGWQRVLGMVRAGEVDVVLAYHLDRITRSMKDLEELIDLSLEFGVGIDTATGDIELTSDMGRMIARILAAVARAEIERKSQRQIDANAQAAAKGIPHPTRCFGYLPGSGNNTVVEAEAEAIRAGAQALLEGQTMDYVRRTFFAKFETGPRTTTGVRLLYQNPRHVGLRVYRGEVIGEGNWEPILDIETHHALLRMLQDPTRIRGDLKTGRAHSTLLGGIATCRHCGGTVKGGRNHGRFTYNCTGSPTGGSHVQTRREEADAYVLEVLTERLAHPDFLKQLAVHGAQHDVEKYAQARDQAAKLRERKNGLARSYAAGLIDDTQLAEGSAELDKLLSAAEGVLLSQPMAASLKDLKVGTPEVRKQIVELPLARKRQLVDAWLTIELVQNGKGPGRKPVEEQVVIDPQEEAVVAA